MLICVGSSAIQGATVRPVASAIVRPWIGLDGVQLTRGHRMTNSRALMRLVDAHVRMAGIIIKNRIGHIAGHM